MMEIAFLILLVWAISTEIRLSFHKKRINEITDIAIECGHIVENMIERLEDDGR